MHKMSNRLEKASYRLLQAIKVGLVVINHGNKTARTMAPPNVKNFTDDDWLLLLRAAGELERELETLGYRVNPDAFERKR